MTAVFRQFPRTLLVLAVAAFVAGCGGKVEKQEQSSQLPEGHPPVGDSSAPMARLGSDAPTDDNPLPLKLTGLNSLEEMKRGMQDTDNAQARADFESGYRKTFTADASKRDYQGAAEDLKKAISLDPNYAEAHRALGYAEFNLGFNVPAAMAEYQKAVELKPDYGEAHYALAFMYAMEGQERAKGLEHYKKAMELGIKDERGLGQRFYNGQ